MMLDVSSVSCFRRQAPPSVFMPAFAFLPSLSLPFLELFQLTTTIGKKQILTLLCPLLLT